MKSTPVILILLILCSGVWAQKATPVHTYESQPILGIRIAYTYQQPGGDLANRFGDMHQVGTAITLKSKRNWVAEAELGYQFGDQIREQNLFLFLTNSSGYIANTGGFPANYYLSERGLNMTIRGGKVFQLFESYPNTGIIATIGAGYYLHKLYINNKTNDIPTLTSDLQRGYDRLTGGFGMSGFLGWVFHSRNRFINFYAGVEYVQAYTYSLRKYNYDTRSSDTRQRLDAMTGFKFGWIIPIYLNSSEEDEFMFR